MVDLAEWAGRVTARTDNFDDLHVAVVGDAGHSWSSPIRVTADDRRDYFIKVVEACPPDQQRSVVTEFVVARLGQLVGAPMCSTTLIRIPDALDGYEVRQGLVLRAGIAHASRALDRCQEFRPALHARPNDDNRSRHVGAYAIFDWCVGADQQWLCDLDNDYALYSHDHGLYLPPPGSGCWDAASLAGNVSMQISLPDPPQGLDRGTIEEVADRVESCARDQLTAIMNGVPESWPVSNGDLEALGWFLEERAPGVAGRLRGLAA